MKQYEVWWAELPKSAGRRPVLLLSRNSAYEVLNKYIAAEITSTIRRIPIEVPLVQQKVSQNPAPRTWTTFEPSREST